MTNTLVSRHRRRSEKARLQRLRYAAAKRDLRITATTYTSQWFPDLGRYALVDVRSTQVVQTHINSLDELEDALR